jgi:hypothetical protein
MKKICSTKIEFPMLSQRKNRVAPSIPVSTVTGFEIFKASKVCLDVFEVSHIQKAILPPKGPQPKPNDGWMLTSNVKKTSSTKAKVPAHNNSLENQSIFTDLLM